MLEQLWGEIQFLFSKLLSLIGWEGIELTWVHWLVISLALVGVLVVLRNLIGGRSGGGGGGSSYSSCPTGLSRGLPTSFYVGSKRMGDFSVPNRLYDFRTPTVEPRLDLLKGKVDLSLDKARSLFLVKPASPLTKGLTTNPSPIRDLGGAEKSSSVVGDTSRTPEGGERRVAADGSGTSQPATPKRSSTMATCFGLAYGRGPNWEQARKLFLPRIRRS